MINSNIKAITSHTKANLIPNKLKVKPIVGSTLTECFWDGIPVPVLIQPYHDDTPVYYRTSSIPTMSVVGLNASDYNFNIIREIQVPNWDKSEDPCEMRFTGCYLAEITVNTNSVSTSVTLIDECGNERSIPSPQKLSADFTFCLQVDNTTTVCADLDGVCIHSLDDPYTVRLENEDKNYLQYAKMFDIQDNMGNGMVFGNNDSSVSHMLSSIFNDEFTNKLNGKIKNFGDNIHNVDKSDTIALEDLGESIGVANNNLSEGIPTEIQDILKLGSMSYEDVFGYQDYSVLFDTDNVGDLLDPSDTVKTGQSLFTKPLLNPESDYEVFTVSKPNSLSSLNTGVLLGVDEFALSSIDNGVYNTKDYCFWENNNTNTNKRIGGCIDDDYITFYPTKGEWYDLIQKKIEFQLNKNLLG